MMERAKPVFQIILNVLRTLHCLDSNNEINHNRLADRLENVKLVFDRRQVLQIALEEKI